MNRRKFVRGALGAGALCAASPVVAAGAVGTDAIKTTASTASRDVWLGPAEKRLLPGVLRRMFRVRRTVGAGNFGVLSFDEMVSTAKAYSSIGAFPARELAFLEQLFFEEAWRYGFLGRKVVRQLTHSPQRQRMRVVRGTGHRLFDGEALAFYQRMHRDVGQDLVLTSGVRSVVKQFHLFLRKVQRTDGNLSLASRSLAPPGYSFHGIGDFDVGMRGFGLRNFREDFASTEVYRKLVDLGYVHLRYPQGNPFGVRYEPWHIRVVSG